ncbi:Endoribonuclease Dicer2 [Sesamum angolense]|uniref:Endoribonuclease Dicer2 n=1 Tax=Sesamum angolense TaxID=2727404 RepID=A0AAE1T399_9LAMI|nr:Endoribonuclease Dicer2 [Sesamum angolense]
MEIDMSTNGRNGQVVADPVPFARSYQLEALEAALKQNTIVFFETGTGKTLIAIMLLQLCPPPQKAFTIYCCFFGPDCCPGHPSMYSFKIIHVILPVGEVVAKHTDLKVGEYYGEMGVDYWDAATWKDEKDKYEVLVMTPQILLNALRRRFLRLDQVKVLIFDECHNARGKHPYACIMTEFYHRELASSTLQLPRVFGMTASPIKAKASSSAAAYWKQIKELETLMNSKDGTVCLHMLLRFCFNSVHSIFNPKMKIYSDMDAPRVTSECLTDDLINLRKKVLGDIIESLAGAIFVDSGYIMEVVFQCMRPLLEPLITPETLKLHPVRELNELCQREHYVLNKTIVCNRNGKACATVEVEASGVVYKETCSGADRKMAKRLACKAVLKSLKERMPTGQ